MWFVNLGHEKLFNFLSDTIPTLACIAQNDIDVPIGEHLKAISNVVNADMTPEQVSVLKTLKAIIIKNKFEITDREKVLEMCNNYLKNSYTYHKKVIISGVKTFVFSNCPIQSENYAKIYAYTVDFTDFKKNIINIPIIDAISSQKQDSLEPEWFIIPF